MAAGGVENGLQEPDSVMGAPPICPVKTMSDNPPDEERPLTVALIS